MADAQRVYENPWLRLPGAVIPNWLMIRVEISLQAKVVWGLLAAERNALLPKEAAVDSTYRGGVPALAQRAGSTEEIIQAALQELISVGLVGVTSDGLQLLPTLWADCTFTRIGKQAVHAQHPLHPWFEGREVVRVQG